MPLPLCGAGEWLAEKHGTRTRRSWRKMHIGVDADTGRIVAATLTDRDVDDASQVGPLLDQVAGSVASFTGDGKRQKPGALRRELDCLLAEASVQHRGPDLEHTVCASQRPAHLPPLVHARVDQLVDRALGP